jgi:hypothetical protein
VIGNPEEPKARGCKIYRWFITFHFHSIPFLTSDVRNECYARPTMETGGSCLTPWCTVRELTYSVPYPSECNLLGVRETWMWAGILVIAL